MPLPNRCDLKFGDNLRFLQLIWIKMFVGRKSQTLLLPKLRYWLL